MISPRIATAQRVTRSGTPIVETDSIRIVDMPDLGAMNDASSVVGERAGSGRFTALALRDYVAAAFAGITIPTSLSVAAGYDNAPTIQAAMDATAAAGGGEVLLPRGVYGIKAQLNYPTAAPVILRGVGAGISTIRAISGFPTNGTMLVKDSVYTYYGGAEDITLDGNKIAGYNLIHQAGQGWLFRRVNFINATLTNVLVGTGAGGNVETMFDSCLFWNSHLLYSGAADPLMPDYNLHLTCSDCHITNCVFINCDIANITENFGANHFLQCHTYGYGTSGVTGYTPQYGFSLSGAQNILIGCGVDNAQIAAYDIGAAGQEMIVGCYAQQADSAFPAVVGVRIAPGSPGNVINGVQFLTGITAANAIVQGGAASAVSPTSITACPFASYQGPLPVNASNDAAAAAAGVPVTGNYRNGSVWQVRVV